MAELDSDTVIRESAYVVKGTYLLQNNTGSYIEKVTDKDITRPGRNEGLLCMILAGKISSLMCRIDRVEQENATLKEETAGTVVRVRGLESGIGIPPFSFVVDNFRRRQALAEDCLSPPFTAIFMAIGCAYVCHRMV